MSRTVFKIITDITRLRCSRAIPFNLFGHGYVVVQVGVQFFRYVGMVIGVILISCLIELESHPCNIGSGIGMYGTIGGETDTCANCVATSLSWSIDGITQPVINISDTDSTRHHTPFLLASQLVDGLHSLSVQVLTSVPNSSKQSNFFPDYFIYEATINSTIPNSDNQTSWIFVDDQSPYLDYGDFGWSSDVPAFSQSGSFNITDISFNSSLTFPTETSSLVMLNFSGTYIVAGLCVIHVNAIVPRRIYY